MRNVRIGEVWRHLRESDYLWLLPSLAALILAAVLRGLRWQLLFAPETRPPFRPVLSAMLIGQLFNNVLPVRAGEAARIVALNRSVGTPRAEIAGTVVVERAYDVLTVLVLLFIGLPWFPHVSWLRAAAIFAVVLTAAMVAIYVVLAVYGERPLKFALRPLARLPFVSHERTELAAGNIVHGMAGLRRPRMVVAALFWTTASWILLGVSTWCVLRGFASTRHLSPVAGVLVVIAVALALILPSSPGAVGVFEWSTQLALGAYGISKEAALAPALVLHVVNFVPYIAAGLLILVHQASGRGSRDRLAAERQGPGGPAGLQNR